MLQGNILEAVQGRNEDGTPRACVCLQILNMGDITADRSDRENIEHVETICCAFTTFAEVKIAVYEDLVSIDLIFENRTDYDFLQFMDVITVYEQYVHDTPVRQRMNYMLLTVSRTEAPDSYVNAIAGAYLVQSSDSQKDLGNMIRFMFHDKNVYTFQLPQNE
jgi:hypothetical protein